MGLDPIGLNFPCFFASSIRIFALTCTLLRLTMALGGLNSLGFARLLITSDYALAVDYY